MYDCMATWFETTRSELLSKNGPGVRWKKVPIGMLFDMEAALTTSFCKSDVTGDRITSNMPSHGS